MSATTTACVAATTAVAARVAPGARAPASRVARAVRPRRSVVVRAQESSISEKLELTAENVELVLDEVRPYLIADGGDVELVEIDGLVVRLKLNGACGSCPRPPPPCAWASRRGCWRRSPRSWRWSR